MKAFIGLLEKNLLPDPFIRYGIRRLLAQRLRDENKGDTEKQQIHFMKLVEELKNSPIAVNTKDANEQHYEVPTEFFQLCLGKNLKYSSAYYKSNENSPLSSGRGAGAEASTLDQAEDDMLDMTVTRAELQNGHHILEMGCGWGSLTLYMAKRFPQSIITGVSNSKTQKEYIESQAKARGLSNITIITCDMNEFTIDKKFDRVVSVEMFEHMRNYQLLMQKVAGFLKDDGKLFVHIFTHKEYAYKFEVVDESDWMSKYFFTGGIMPSNHLLLYFADHLKIEKHWNVNGMHYGLTSEDWLKNMDANKSKIMPLFEQTYGKENALKWWVYWRVFYLACAELWKYNNGNEWMVCHYLFKKPK